MALLLLLAACGEQAPPPPNVLVITLDTVRADRLGCYGHAGRDLTPNLDRLAAESVLFTQAFANSSFTPPSHASILTGLYPAEHGLLHWNKHLADVPTAAERFAAAGWRTAAWTPLPTLFKLGLERGFARSESPPVSQEQGLYVLGDAVALNALALPYLTAEAEQPFFAWLHYYDAHRPYGRQGEGWAHRYNAAGDLSVGATEDWYQLDAADRAALRITPEQTQFIKDRYDGGLAWLDAQVGLLLDGLRSSGVLDRTILIVTADHGEVLDEHPEDWFSHDPHLYDENVHVPLLVRLPGGESGGRRVGELVQGVDILPTLLELTWLSPDETLSGESLVPLLHGGSLHRAFVFADRQGNDLSQEEDATDEAVHASRDRRRMLRSAEHKYVHDVDQDRARLFVLPDETRDVSTEQPALADDYAGAYAGIVRALHLPQAVDGGALDPETEAFLEALGYVR